MVKIIDALKKPSRRRLTPQERRRQLLETAITLFAEQGFGEAKHADIAARAGTSTATTFVYFPTREALLDAVTEEVGRFYLSLFDGLEDQAIDPDAVLHVLAEKLLMAAEHRLDYTKVQLGWAARFDVQMRQKYRAFEDGILTKISSVLDGAMEQPDTVNRDDARILMSASQTLAYMKLDGEDPAKLQRFIDHTIDVVLAHRRR